ncbi:MAG TPA: alpha-L-rhamnosidase C-terminal domain-containing protein, partial [Verrucomicrobiota bacterium]|nr:alpha-L-rhamnosidase C-terminal domain-containing protein [Verrucomicrobiota bacterium]
ANFTSAKACYKSIRGLISSSWKIEGKTFNLSITIPANTTAIVYVPANSIDNVKENNKPVSKSSDIKFLRTENNYVVFEVGSGEYNFKSQL